MGFLLVLLTLTVTRHPANSSEQIDCLSKVIYHEARGEPLEGKVAVGYVVLNRTQNNQWPDTICSVVTQPRQFSNFNLNIPIERTSEAWKTSLDTARKVYYKRVRDPTKGALFFFNPKKASPHWRNKFTYLADIGNHRFLTVKEKTYVE